MYELGIVVSLAFNSPKDLKQLDPEKQAAMRAVQNLADSDALPAMLRIPKKRSKVEDNGQ